MVSLMAGWFSYIIKQKICKKKISNVFIRKKYFYDKNVSIQGVFKKQYIYNIY